MFPSTVLRCCDVSNLRMEIFCTHLRVSSYIVHVDAQQVTQAVGHEDGAHEDLHHVLHTAIEDANLHQLLQVDPVSQAVHVGPLHAFNTTTFHLDLYSSNILSAIPL